MRGSYQGGTKLGMKGTGTKPATKRAMSPAALRKAGFTTNPQPAPEPIDPLENRRGSQLWATLMTRDVR